MRKLLFGVGAVLALIVGTGAVAVFMLARTGGAT